MCGETPRRFVLQHWAASHHRHVRAGILSGRCTHIRRRIGSTWWLPISYTAHRIKHPQSISGGNVLHASTFEGRGRILEERDRAQQSRFGILALILTTWIIVPAFALASGGRMHRQSGDGSVQLVGRLYSTSDGHQPPSSLQQSLFMSGKPTLGVLRSHSAAPRTPD